MMSYIDLINGFERVCESEALPAASQLLWYKLIYLFNRRGWPEWVQVDNMRLMSVSGIKDEKTLIRSRSKLIELGLFEYKPGKKGFPGRYSIKEYTFTGFLPVNTPVNVPVEMPVNMTVNTPVNVPVETPDIIRHKTKTKTKTEKKTTDVVQKNFVPPSVEEVRTYCFSRRNGVDPERFVDFYSAKGWMVGKNKMKDWKACVRTWERREKGEGYGKQDVAADDGICKQLAREGRIPEFTGFD